MFLSYSKPFISGPICVFIAVLLCVRQIWRLRKLPPGPPGGFLGLGDHTTLIRNVDGLLWNRYRQWAKQYGMFSIIISETRSANIISGSVFSYRLGGNIVVGRSFVNQK